MIPHDEINESFFPMNCAQFVTRPNQIRRFGSHAARSNLAAGCNAL